MMKCRNIFALLGDVKGRGEEFIIRMGKSSEDD